jgi:hypothetical protein
MAEAYFAAIAPILERELGVKAVAK